MDERLLLFVWLVGSAGYFGLLGAAFGALAGNISWRQGRPVGTAIGLGVLRNVERVARQRFTPGGQGSLVGAVDGFLFLAGIGLVFGLVASSYRLGLAEAGMVALGALLLVAGALFFGGIGILARQGGHAGVAALFFGALLAGSIGYLWTGSEGLLIGILGGAAVGLLIRRGTRPPLIDPPSPGPAVSETSEDDTPFLN
jgi:hypothetical protein